MQGIKWPWSNKQMGMPPREALNALGVTSKWECPPRKALNGGLDWWGAMAANGCSGIKIGIPQHGATNGGQNWPGPMAANGLSAIKLEFPKAGQQMVAGIGQA